MIYRSLSLTALALVAALFTSCGGSGPNVISKSSIRSGSGIYAKRESFALPPASSQAVAAAAGKPRDKHSMPVYAFSDRNRIVRTTAYTSTESDHLIYGDKNATGTTLRYNDRVRSAAADWSFYPVGTTFRIKGLPYLYVVDDYGSALLGTGTVDIYTPTKEVMGLWATRTVEMTVVQWGSMTRSAELLSQRTSYDHCRKMLANIVRQRPDLGNVAKN
ncbi:MAG: 3D domain-containing protein [Luteolibacter sp.]|uniref:3D domain-containing protein n=1 Tax=Luteolibacter sp. TaxID=1962973 RepID=UPI0032632AD7